jgi:hypothetical protein
MTALAVSPPNRSGFAGRVWLPLSLSLALHALFGLAVLAVSAGAESGRRPVPVDAVVLEGGTIILDEPSHGRPGQHGPANSGDQASEEEESEEPFQATVDELPVLPPPPSLPGGAGAAAGSSAPLTSAGAGGDASHGGAGGGLLRAPATARKVVYVIDRSLSMGLSGALTVAKHELLGSIAALPIEAEFAVIFYNREAELLTVCGQPGLLPATAENRATVARLVEEIHAEGGTDHVAALRRAVALGPDVIFFVTDADELTTEQVSNVAQLNHGRAAIHAVQLGSSGQHPDETPLQLLARRSGGTYRIVPVHR